jgi:hypothetical protein
VFDGWRTVALDVLVPVSEPRRSRRARRDAAAETAPADAAAGSVQDGAADSEVEAVADEAATAAS